MVNKVRLGKNSRFDEAATASSQDPQAGAVPSWISRGTSAIQGLKIPGGREWVAGRRLMERVRSPASSNEKGPISSINKNAASDQQMLLSNLQLPSC